MSKSFRPLWLCALFSLALVVRVVFALWFGSNGLTVSDDAQAYHDLAVNLVEHHRFVTTADPPHRLDLPYATRPPLTPFVLALLYRIFGPDLFVGQLFFALVGAASVIVLYFLGTQLFSSQVGLIAGLLAVLYPFFVFLAAVPLTENLSILLYTSLALSLTRLALSPTPAQAILGGCLLGLAALNRPQLLGFFPLLFLWAWFVLKMGTMQKVKTLLLIFVSAALLIAPWTIRNYLLLHRWIPISLQLGGALLLGNNPYTGEALAKLQDGVKGWYTNKRMGENMTGSSAAEVDREALQLALAFVQQHPDLFIRYALQKLQVFWSAYDRLVHKASWYPILALGLLGFLWNARHWRALLPLYLLIVQTVLIAAVFTSLPRHRAPIEPFFLLLAASVLTRLWERRMFFCRMDAIAECVWL